jgi:hypothetical protein
VKQLEITINPDFQGPTLVELEPVLDDVLGRIEVRWENSKAEIALLEEYTEHSYSLYVKDIKTLESASSTLGVPFQATPELIESAKLALSSRKSAHNWESITKEYGTNVTRSLLASLVSESIRKGKNAALIAPVAREILLDGVAPVDASILIRVRGMRGH